MNTAKFIAEQKSYFANSYEQFEAFGGPCVHFHLECLRAGRDAFLSQRHVETLYATLTAWGLHRMGDAETTKAKLKNWDQFRDSILTNATELRRFLPHNILKMSADEYSQTVLQLRPYYESLELSVSDATVVVNSKALHHLFPELIPPIDRQYTIRFFSQSPEKWRDYKGRFRAIQLPPGRDAQFTLFHQTCVRLKKLSDQVDPALFEVERRLHGVSAPKAIDNAIVSFVRTVSAQSTV